MGEDLLTTSNNLELLSATATGKAAEAAQEFWNCTCVPMQKILTWLTRVASAAPSTSRRWYAPSASASPLAYATDPELAAAFRGPEVIAAL